MTATLNDVAASTVAENVPSLADLAEEPGGAWPAGWYAAEIIEGYATPKGKQFSTSDAPSKGGDSRNLRLCFKVQGPGGERLMQESFNYRQTDFTPERIADIKAGREEHKGVQGKWNDAPDLQRSSLAVAKIGALEKAIGFTIRNEDGVTEPARVVGQRVDIRLTVNDDGYNVVSKFAKAGEKVKSA